MASASRNSKIVAKEVSDYTFALDFIDEGFCFCGSVDINGEENFSEEEKDMRYYGAYLLNLSHKQLDEFLEVEDGKVKNDIDKFIKKLDLEFKLILKLKS